MRRSKSKNINQDKFAGAGVNFKSKLIGIASVVAPRGDEICADALSVLKTAALRNNKEKKEHKQRITINITLKGIRLIDEASERIDHAHPISRISFISLDKTDKRTFGYIVGIKDEYKFFAIKAMKEAETITATLKELFQEVYKRHQEKMGNTSNDVEVKEEETGKEEVFEPTCETEVNGQIDAAEEVVEASKEKPDSQLILELNDQIEEMRNVGIMSHSTSFDMMDDPFNTDEGEAVFKGDAFDDNFAPTQTTNSINLLDNSSPTKTDVVSVSEPKETQVTQDLFSAIEPAAPSVPTIKPSASYQEELSVLTQPISQPNGNEPSLMAEDPFDSLKKSINELHKQNMVQQQQQQMPFNPSFPQMSQQPMAGQYQINQSAQYQTNHVSQQNMYNNSMTNPFQTNMFPSPPVPARPDSQQQQQQQQQQQHVPFRPQPTATNPFLSQTKLTEPTNGWTVLKTSPVPPRKPLNNPSGPDPFSFLNDQPAMAAKTIEPPNVVKNDMLDLLS